MNRPIFVVGSPRSGTSILTWCLGQHSNILAQEESNWLSRFSVDVEAAYETGTGRGERAQLSALGVSREAFFAAFGDAINKLILSHRQEQTRIARAHALAASDCSQILPAFKTERSERDPKQRWVDGTPEYSFYICGLRKLFPHALFIHLLRDVAEVVRSILHFAQVGGRNLAENEQEAYDYWLRTVHACAQAERAYGSWVVRRVLYADLIAAPERTMQSVLSFLDEPYEAACLEPLQERINSSRVPAGFKSFEPESAQGVAAAARALQHELMNENCAIAPSPEAADELEADFKKKVQHVQNVGHYHAQALTRIRNLEEKLQEQATPSAVGRSLWRKWLGDSKEAR